MLSHFSDPGRSDPYVRSAAEKSLVCHFTGDAREEGVVRDADVVEDRVGGPAPHHCNEFGALTELEESGCAAGAERVGVERGGVDPRSVDSRFDSWTSHLSVHFAKSDISPRASTSAIWRPSGTPRKMA